MKKQLLIALSLLSLLPLCISNTEEGVDMGSGDNTTLLMPYETSTIQELPSETIAAGITSLTTSVVQTTSLSSEISPSTATGISSTAGVTSSLSLSTEIATTSVEQATSTATETSSTTVLTTSIAPSRTISTTTIIKDDSSTIVKVETSTTKVETSSLTVRPTRSVTPSPTPSPDVVLSLKVPELNLTDAETEAQSIREQVADKLSIDKEMVTGVQFFFVDGDGVKTLIIRVPFLRSRRNAERTYNLVELDIVQTNNQSVNNLIQRVEDNSANITLNISGMTIKVLEVTHEVIVPTVTTSSTASTASPTASTTPPTGLTSGAITGIILVVLFVVLIAILVVLALLYLVHRKLAKTNSYSFDKYLSNKNGSGIEKDETVLEQKMISNSNDSSPTKSEGNNNDDDNNQISKL